MAPRQDRMRRDFGDHAADAGDILLGFGASAIGQLPQGYVQNEIHAAAYSETIAAGGLATALGYALTGDERLRAETIGRLIFEFGADPGLCGPRLGSVPERAPSSRRLYDLIFAEAVETGEAGPNYRERRAV